MVGMGWAKKSTHFVLGSQNEAKAYNMENEENNNKEGFEYKLDPEDDTIYLGNWVGKKGHNTVTMIVKVMEGMTMQRSTRNHQQEDLTNESENDKEYDGDNYGFEKELEAISQAGKKRQVQNQHDTMTMCNTGQLNILHLNNIIAHV